MCLNMFFNAINEWLRNHKMFTLQTHLNKYHRIMSFIMNKTKFLDKYDVATKWKAFSVIV